MGSLFICQICEVMQLPQEQYFFDSPNGGPWEQWLKGVTPRPRVVAVPGAGGAKRSAIQSQGGGQ